MLIVPKSLVSLLTCRQELVTGKAFPTQDELQQYAEEHPHGDTAASTSIKGVPYFWLTVLCNQVSAASMLLHTGCSRTGNIRGSTITLWGCTLWVLCTITCCAVHPSCKCHMHHSNMAGGYGQLHKRVLHCITISSSCAHMVDKAPTCRDVLSVVQDTLADEISSRDKQALSYCTSIRPVYSSKGGPPTIEFSFSSNPFFHNSVLKRCLGDKSRQVDEVTTNIDWKDTEHKLTVKVRPEVW